MKVLELKEKELDFISVYESIQDEKVYTLTGSELKNLVQEANHQLIDLFPIGLYVKDKDGVVLACNKEMRTTAGFENYQDIVGKNSYEFSSEETAQEVRANDVLVMEQDIVVIKKEVVMLKDSQEFIHFESSKKAVKNMKGEVIGIAGFSQDICQQKKLEFMKEQKQKNEVEVAIIASSAVTHDLKNTLTPLCLEAELLQKIIPKLDSEMLKKRLSSSEINILNRVAHHFWAGLRNISEEIKMADQFNRELLLGAADEKMEKYFKNFSISSCIYDGMQQNVYAKVKIFNESEDNFQFYGSHFFVLKILGNLIANATRQIQQKGQGTIFISTEITEKYNILKVKDTAGGVTQDLVDKILDLYKTRQAQGTGFGLASAHLWMEKMNGKLEVRLADQDCIEFCLLFPKVL